MAELHPSSHFFDDGTALYPIHPSHIHLSSGTVVVVFCVSQEVKYIVERWGSFGKYPDELKLAIFPVVLLFFSDYNLQYIAIPHAKLANCLGFSDEFASEEQLLHNLPLF